MSLEVKIRQAEPDEAVVVEAMLLEAAQWVDALGEVMWGRAVLRGEVRVSIA